jgi:hypothetical protein
MALLSMVVLSGRLIIILGAEELLLVILDIFGTYGLN